MIKRVNERNKIGGYVEGKKDEWIDEWNKKLFDLNNR